MYNATSAEFGNDIDMSVTERTKIVTAFGEVEHATKEALTHTLGAQSYSFFSEAKPMDHYKFNIQDFKSYLLSKSQGRVNKEMVHVMHYHGVENVPLFQEQMDQVRTKGTHEPIKMKFLANTPLAQKRGVNMLMPITKDVRMTDAPNKPDPPDSPIIEDEEEEGSKEEKKRKGEMLDGDKIVEGIEEDGNAESVTSGPTHGHRSKPIILKPARSTKSDESTDQDDSKPAMKEDVRDYQNAPSESSGGTLRLENL